MDPVYYTEIAHYLIKSLRRENISALKTFLNRTLKESSPELYGRIVSEFETRAQEVERGIYDVTLPRDVFIAYRSTDIERAREISATIVAKSIAFDKLTDAAVAEIRDAITLEPGSENGTLSFRGVDVKVTGLKSAAYEDVSYFDAAGSASAALDSAKQYADEQIDQKLTDSLTWKDFE